MQVALRTQHSPDEIRNGTALERLHISKIFNEIFNRKMSETIVKQQR